MDVLNNITNEIDIRINSLNRIAEELNNLIENTKNVDIQIINLKKIEERTNIISSMKYLHSELQKTITIVTKNGIAAEEYTKNEIHSIQDNILKIQKPTPKIESSSEKSICIIGNISIQATILPVCKTNEEIINSIHCGVLYYIPQWNHFATKIGKCLFHANLGKIYFGQIVEVPKRVKECQKNRCRGESECKYYHDPMSYPNSTDVRNFTADSWIYNPNNVIGRNNLRHIGSIDFLENDLKALSIEDANKFLNQTSHDILCSIIIQQYLKL